MKTLLKTCMILFVISLISCEESIEEMADKSDLLVGYWVNPTMVDTCWRYERANGLQDDDYGLSFQPDYSFVERKNTSWCGTPPIVYANYEGTWTRKDSIISVSVDYWGGMANYQWKIISIDDHYLTVYRMKEEYGK